uniref:Uncharacterized protein n=1 Tax=Helianthus annuus TaxID=4232 RepID=A0A251TAH0_HELAN
MESISQKRFISRRSIGSKPVETDGAPLVDTQDLKAMIRLLRVVQYTRNNVDLLVSINQRVKGIKRPTWEHLVYEGNGQDLVERAGYTGESEVS